jgi:hypothetical protein
MAALSSDRRRLAISGAFIALATALFASLTGLGLVGSTATLWIDDVATAGAIGLAAAACWRARARHEGQERRFWTVLCAAAASWTLAEVIWAVYDLVLHRDVPVPSWADLGYLTAIPLTIAALLLHPASRGGGVRRARWIFEGAVVAAALIFMSWTLVLGPLADTLDFSSAEGITTLAYPVGDLAIVFVVVLAIRGMSGVSRLSLWTLLAALVLMALSDSAYSYLSGVGDYEVGGWIDAGWFAAYLGIAVAAWVSGTGDVVVPAHDAAPRLSRLALLAPLVPVFIALAVATVEIRRGNQLDAVGWASIVALIGMVLIRQALMILELFGTGNANGARAARPGELHPATAEAPHAR